VVFTKVIDLVAENELDRAETECRKVLRSDSENINILALLGAILLKSDRLDEAESILLKIVAMAPAFAKPHQDLAVLYVNRGNFRAAEKHFRHATEIDPSQPSAFSGLSQVLSKLGDDKGASVAFDRYLALAPDNSLARVVALHQSGDLKKARLECGRLLASEPENLGAIRRLAMISAEEGQLPEAERMLRHMVRLAPGSIVPHMDLASLCVEQQDFVEAIGWLQRAVEIAPENGEVHLMLAHSRLMVGHVAAALEGYLTCLALNPNDTQAMLGRGNALRGLGRGSDAISVYQQCLTEEDIFADACWSLASMRTYEFSDRELNRMIEHCKNEGIASHALTRLDFALGKALDDREEYDAAWMYYVSGNTRQRIETSYDAVEFESTIDTLIEIYSKGFCVRKPVSMPTDPTPIFVVGMPRAGSTLLEQILVSHNQVEETAELPYLRRIAARVNVEQRLENSSAIIDLDEEALKALGDEYIAATSIHRPHRKPFFVDKLPANFPYVGFIHLVLPEAIVIDARRQSLDTCVANYRQLYPQGKEFSYDLIELSEMYLQYVRMMNHWDKVLPAKVLTVHYEEVVANAERQIRRMLEHCGLGWDEACLDFQLTDRTFSTASSEQVRQPVYSSSIGYWRHYEEHLAELAESLASVIEES